MAKTVNRIPNQVNYPTAKSVKDYFFNHYEWKGINDDKNFLEVDQKTFQKAENVYIDSEGLLRSRPAIKKSNITLFNISLDNPLVLGTLQNVIDFWKFGDIVVYYCHDITIGITTYDYVLLFTRAEEHVRDEGIVVKALSEDLSTLSDEFEYNYNEIKVIMAKNKIFVFTHFSISYYDMDTWAYYNSNNVDYVNPIYVPTTKVITSTTTTDLESPNILTNQEIYNYLYNAELGVNANIYDKTVVFELNGTKYSVVFKKSTPMTLVENLLYVDFSYDRNRDYIDTFTGVNVKSRKMNMAISKNDSIAIFSETSRTLMLSIDGKTYDYYNLPASAGNIMLPVNFSKDGSLVYIVTDKSIWLLSVYADTVTGVKKYVTFTDASVAYSNFTNWAGLNYEILAACVIGDGDMCVYYRFMSGADKNYGIMLFENNTLHIDNYLNVNGGWEGQHLGPNTRSISNGSITLDYNLTPLTFIADGNNVTSIANITITCYNASALIFFDANDLTYSVDLSSPLVNSNALLKFSGKTLYIFFATRYGTNNTNSGVQMQRGYVDFSGFTDGTVDIGNKLNYAYQRIYDTSIFHPLDTMNVSTKYVSSDTFYYLKMFMYSDADDIIVSPVGIFELSSKVYTPFIVTDDIGYVTPTGVTKYVYYYAGAMDYIGLNDNTPDPTLVYTTKITNTIELKYTNITEYDENDQPILYNFIVPTHHTELHNFYFALDNLLMISADRFDDDKNWCWYFPENQQQKLNYYITALHPINDNIVAAFMEDEVWYIAYNSEAGAYTYQKSKLQLGLPDGNNVITSLDGTTILFVTKRGLVGLGYQDFIASTEQALSYLSDSIFQIFNDWNTEPIRLHLHGFWLICYKQSTDDCYIYDIRNKSWWHCSYPDHNATKFVTDETELIYLSNEKLYDFDRSDNDYHDNDGDTKYIIDWEIASQKLYLDAANYYKHIVNITLNIAIDESASNSQAAPTMNLQICNYRKVRNIVDTENFSYEVDMIRTFVKRLNYFKVCEFQYDLRCDTDNYLQVPLSLADITVKYKIAGEVR